MHVLELVPSLDVGGAERIVGLLARGLSDRGHRVTVVSLAPACGSFIEAELQAAGIETCFLGKGLGLEPRVVPRLARLLRRLRPDVVHTHLHTVKYLLPARAAWPRAPVLHTVHNLAEHEADGPGRAVQQLAFRAGVHPVAIGQAVARSVRRVYRLEPAFTIENGIPVGAFAPAPGARLALRRELGLSAQVPVALVVGRLNPQKDHEGLLRAFADPRLGALQARLLVAGEGDLRPALERQAAASGLTDRVHFLGVRRDVPRLMAAADLFVLASRYEGNPLVVMEAMAAGLPVLSTSVGCVPELVDPSVGALVPPGQPAALAEAMVPLLADLPRCKALGEAALARARARFDAATMAARYEQAFLDLGAGPRRHGRGVR